MKTRDKGYIVIPSVIIALLIFALIRTTTWRYFEDQLMWFLFGGFTLLMTIAVLFHEIRVYRTPAKAEAEAKPEKKKKAGTGGKGLLTILAWAVGYLITAYLVGLIISTALFSAAYVKFVGKRSWLRTLIFTAVLLGGIYLIFITGLQVRLYQGLIFKWLGIRW